MRYEQLGKIVTIQKGKKHNLTFDITSSSTRLLQIEDLRNDKELKYTDDKNGVLATEEDLMIVWDGANAGTIGYGKRGFIGSTISILRKKDPDRFNTRFLGKFLQSQFSVLRRNTTGSTIPHIDRKILENLSIPVLSYSEQIQIAAILTLVETLIAQRKESIRLLDELVKSQFLEMFGDPVKNENWPKTRIGELGKSEKRSMRTGPFGSDLLHSEFLDEGPVLVLGIDNVVKNRFEWGKLRYISAEKFEKLKRYQVFSRDVLISIMATIGKVAVVPENIPLSINSKHLAALTVDENKVDPYFLSYSLHSDSKIIGQLQGAKKGAIMEGLNLTIIKNLELHLPPITLQVQFTQFNLQIEKLKKIHMESLKQLESLYSSLSQKAFRGELTFEKESIALNESKLLESDVAKETASQPRKQNSVKTKNPKIIQLKPTNVDFYKRTVLAAEIVWQLHREPTFGHLKLQKLLFLCIRSSNMQLPVNFTQQAMGPYANRMMRPIDKQLQEKNGFFMIRISL